MKKNRDPIKNIKNYALEGNLATEEELKVLVGGRRHFSLVLSYVFSGSHQSWILLLDPTYSYSKVLLIADIKHNQILCIFAQSFSLLIAYRK